MAARSSSVGWIVVFVLVLLCAAFAAAKDVITDSAGCVTTVYPGVSSYYGGGSATATAFSDEQNPYTCGTQYPYSILVTSGQYIDGLLTYYSPGNVTPGQDGSNTGTGSQITLAKNTEFINYVSVTGATYIDSITFNTTLGHYYSFGGTGGTLLFTSSFEEGEYLAYFAGTEGSFIDSIRFTTFRVSTPV